MSTSQIYLKSDKFSDKSQLLIVTSAMTAARSLRELINKGPFSAAQAVRMCENAIDGLRDTVNAVVADDLANARITAEEIDNSTGSTDRGVFAGVPVTVSASIDALGLPTSHGKTGMDSHPTRDALVVSRLRDAGAIILGKSNIALDHADMQCQNPRFGATHNPFDVTRTAGGEGNGAAVASGCSAIDIGFDVAGTALAAASYCGVFAHRPTLGALPLHDGFAPAPDMTTVCPTSTSASDLRDILNVIGGYKYATWPRPVSLTCSEAKGSLADFSVCFAPFESELSKVDDDVLDTLGMVKAALNDAGARIIEPKSFGRVFTSQEVHISLLSAMFASEMSEFEYDASSAEIARAYISDCGGMSGDYDPGYVEAVRKHVLNHRAWTEMNKARGMIRNDWDELFSGVDVVIAPVSRTAAFAQDVSDATRPLYMPSGRRIEVNGKATQYADNCYWAGLSSSVCLPSTVVPAGFAGSGLPIGIQLIGRHSHDLVTIDFAAQLHELLSQSH